VGIHPEKQRFTFTPGNHKEAPSGDTDNHGYIESSRHEKLHVLGGSWNAFKPLPF
jgi:hypothetical protein